MNSCSVLAFALDRKAVKWKSWQKGKSESDRQSHGWWSPKNVPKVCGTLTHDDPRYHYPASVYFNEIDYLLQGNLKIHMRLNSTAGWDSKQSLNLMVLWAWLTDCARRAASRNTTIQELTSLDIVLNKCPFTIFQSCFSFAMKNTGRAQSANTLARTCFIQSLPFQLWRTQVLLQVSQEESGWCERQCQWENMSAL